MEQFCHYLNVNKTCLLADVHWAPQHELITRNLLAFLDRYRPETGYFKVKELDVMYLRILNLHYPELFDDNPSVADQILKRVDVHSYASISLDVTQQIKDTAARVYAADYELLERPKLFGATARHHPSASRIAGTS